MLVLDQLVQIAKSWSDKFSTLGRIEEFIEQEIRYVCLEHQKLDEDKLIQYQNDTPETWEDLINFHQKITHDILKLDKDHHKNGNFQTSSQLAKYLTNYTGNSIVSDLRGLDEDFTVIDPTCGTGIFLLSVINWWFKSPIQDMNNIKLQIIGIDRNPLSLVVAWITIHIAENLTGIELSSLLQQRDLLEVFTSQDYRQSCHLVIGNPPWVTWTDLSDEDRNTWKNLASSSKYRYINAKGMNKAMGATNIDIGPLLFLLAVNHFGLHQAWYGYLFKENLINSPSLYWFRQGEIPDHQVRRLSLFKILNFVKQSNFLGTDLPTDWYFGRIDTPPKQRISQLSVRKLSRVKPETNSGETETVVLSRFPVENPVDTFYLPSADYSPIRQKKSVEVEIRHGIKHDCRDVFDIDQELAESIEWQCVYPTIKSRHIQSTGWTGGYDLVIVPNTSLYQNDESTFANQYPLVYSYLFKNKNRLLKRKSRWLKQGPFYSIFGVGDYSLSTYKVAWVRLGWKPYFSVISPVKLPNGSLKPVVPSDHYLFIPTENLKYAKFLVNLLNSQPYQTVLHYLSSQKKSSLPKKLISRLSIPSEKEFTQLDNITPE